VEGKRIVIAYDGSPNSEDALELGKRLCDLLDATPVIASCVLFPTYLMDPPDLGRAVEDDTRPLFDAAGERLAPREIETCSLYNESPARGLQELAEDLGPEAIVVGSGHRGPVGRVLIGSVGEKVLAGAPCPVAVAPRGYADDPHGRLMRIGVAVDGGDESDLALTQAVALAERLNASLTIVSVLGAPPIGYGGMPGVAVGDFDRMQREFTDKVLERSAARVPKGLPVTLRRLEGDPAQRLAAVSESFDLMLIGSRGYGPLRRVLLGSVSAPVMRAAHCPLLVTPRRAREIQLELTSAAERHIVAR
jgi:nucleotide-binding universal stress UspA family protein